VSLEHTLFLDFLKLFVNMPLALIFAGKKTHYLDLWIKSYGYLKFQGEVWVGQAYVGANQQELTTCAKSGGQEEKKIQEKWEQPDKRRCRPTTGRRPAVARESIHVPVKLFQFYFIFFNLKKKNFWKFEKMGQGFWENGCIAPPLFKACPYTWKC
jgi:hypothetical protein